MSSFSETCQLYCSWKLFFGSYPKLMLSNILNGRNILPWFICLVTMHLKKNHFVCGSPISYAPPHSFLQPIFINRKVWVCVLFSTNKHYAMWGIHRYRWILKVHISYKTFYLTWSILWPANRRMPEMSVIILSWLKIFDVSFKREKIQWCNSNNHFLLVIHTRN